MPNFADTELNEFTEERQKITQDLTTAIQQTKVQADRLGYVDQEHVDFEQQIQRLNTDVIKMAVIGEFSRGKSHMVNAILRKEILPRASRQTTAINTFVQGCGSEEPYLELIYWDPSKNPTRLKYTSDALIKWSTELNKQNKEARKELRKVNLYTDHPLFQRNFILIDTPGFGGLEECHEEIAMRAMDESHIAIWCQEAGQLGATRDEWEFLKEKILLHSI